MIDLLALRQALMVQEQGSFRKAAVALRLPTSVISRRIRSLEDFIGVGLFRRRSQGAVPTIAGQHILTQATAILAEVEMLARTAALTGSGIEGELCVGVVSCIAAGHIHDLLSSFMTTHFGVALYLIEGLPQDHVAAVRALRMDIALVVASPAARGCIVELLWTEPIYVAVSAKSALAQIGELRWEHLASELFIVSNTRPGIEIQDIVTQHLMELGRRPAVEFPSRSTWWSARIGQPGHRHHSCGHG